MDRFVRFMLDGRCIVVFYSLCESRMPGPVGLGRVWWRVILVSVFCGSDVDVDDLTDGFGLVEVLERLEVCWDGDVPVRVMVAVIREVRPESVR